MTAIDISVPRPIMIGEVVELRMTIVKDSADAKVGDVRIQVGVVEGYVILTDGFRIKFELVIHRS